MAVDKNDLKMNNLDEVKGCCIFAFSVQHLLQLTILNLCVLKAAIDEFDNSYLFLYFLQAVP